MAAANPAQRPLTGLPPNYRRYDLPWSPSEEMERRFRVILRNLTIVFGILAVLMPFLPRHERVVNTESLPEIVVQWFEEPPAPARPRRPPTAENRVEKPPFTSNAIVPVDPGVKGTRSAP